MCLEQKLTSLRTAHLAELRAFKTELVDIHIDADLQVRETLEKTMAQLAAALTANERETEEIKIKLKELVERTALEDSYE